MQTLEATFNTPCRIVLAATDAATVMLHGIAIGGIIIACDALHIAAGRPALSNVLSESQMNQMAYTAREYATKHPDAPLIDAVQHSYNLTREKLIQRPKTH
jgi:endonuclease V-like protein UPF0215 family